MIIIVAGGTGVGKTAFGSSVGMVCMNGDWAQDSVKKCRRIVEKLPPSYRSEMSDEIKHLVLTSYDLEGRYDGWPTRKAYRFDPFRFGVQNPDFETDWFPYCSVIIIDEAQKYFGNDVTIFRPTMELLEENRHSELNILMLTPRIDGLTKSVRALANKIIKIESLTNFDRFHKPIKMPKKTTGNLFEMPRIDLRRADISMSRWKGWEFDGFAAAEAYLGSGKAEKHGKPFRHEYKGNVYQCYDSFEHKYDNLIGREGQQFKMEAWTRPQIAIPEELAKTYGVQAPKGFSKRRGA